MTSDPLALLASLRARRFALRVEDGSRLVVTPGSELTAEDREAIRECKPALVALVESEGLLLTHAHPGQTRGFSDWKKGDRKR